jgi:uncharacterized membrane protein
MPNKKADEAKRTGAFASGVEFLRLTVETTRRAFVEFLTIPTIVIAAFLLLATLTFFLDRGRMTTGEMSEPMWGGLFSDAEAARNFLGVIASSIIRVTSITLSLLLIAVQQGAASLTSQVFDQFLRRRANQLYFGFFIGLALYALIVLASINPAHQPIYGVALAGLFTVIALYMLILLIYTTINQMRPVVIIKSIHDHVLLARNCQVELLRATRRTSRLSDVVGHRVVAERNGFMTRVDIAAIDRILTNDNEVIVLASIGDYVAFGEPVVEIRTAGTAVAPSLMTTIEKAVILEEQRDLDTDPAFGIEQIETIGWTSISTAKSNPGPGLLTIWHLRDLLARWCYGDAAFGAENSTTPGQAAHVVYYDNLPERLMQAFESLVIVSSESMQHQKCGASVLYVCNLATSFAAGFATTSRRSHSALAFGPGRPNLDL